MNKLLHNHIHWKSKSNFSQLTSKCTPLAHGIALLASMTLKLTVKYSTAQKYI